MSKEHLKPASEPLSQAAMVALRFHAAAMEDRAKQKLNVLRSQLSTEEILYNSTPEAKAANLAWFARQFAR